ncbi:MAG: hypothetical protein AB1798_14790, partial [Spirochaetota bacterium]
DDEKAAAETESDLWDSFAEYVYGLGDNTEDSWAAKTPIKSAYLKLNKIAGVVDLTFELNGTPVGVGSMVTSDKSAGDANLGVTLGLSDGVVPGLSASILVNQAAGVAAVSDSGDTWSDETDAEEKAVLGSLLKVGYSMDVAGMKIGAVLKAGIKDFAAIGENLVLGFEPSFSMPDLMALAIKGEVDLLLLGSGTTGLGLGAGVSAAIMGISPSVNFYMKNASYYGDDSYDFFDADDIDDSSAMAEFNSIDDKGATLINVGLTVDLASILGMKLITLNAGGDFFLGDGYTNVGLNGGVDLTFADLIKIPLTVGFTIGQYAENDLTWAGTIGYTYAEIFKATFKLEQTEADVIGYSIGGKVSF